MSHRRPAVPLRVLLATCALAAVPLTGCGSASSGEDPPAQTVTQTVSDVVTETTATTVTTAAATPAPKPKPKPKPAAKPRDCIVVPDVVGGDHQLAQDTMQAAGLYLLDEEDATGQGRMLILDRNWTVVRQRPAAGSCVSEDTEILLSSKKDGE